MFCAFEGPANILRVYGRGETCSFDEPEFAHKMKLFPSFERARGVITVRIRRVADSCGWSVPFFDHKGERDQLRRWVVARTDEEWARRGGTKPTRLPSTACPASRRSGVLKSSRLPPHARSGTELPFKVNGCSGRSERKRRAPGEDKVTTFIKWDMRAMVRNAVGSDVPIAFPNITTRNPAAYADRRPVNVSSTAIARAGSTLTRSRAVQ